MTALTATSPTALAAATAEAALVEAAPDLVPAFREHLPRALDVVARRLVGAAYREGLTGGPEAASWAGDRAFLPVADGGYLAVRVRRHGFGRIELTEPLVTDPARLLNRLAGADARPIAIELRDAAVNLALAHARREQYEPSIAELLDPATPLDPDTRAIHFERLSTEGHNLHPSGRARIGWGVPDLLAYDLEAPATSIGFVGVRRDRHIGTEIGPALLGEQPLDPVRYAITPAHPWQLHRIVPERYADLVADGALVPLEHELPALATASLRTLLLPLAGCYAKVSLDVQITSTRRSISVASSQNGPVLSAYLTEAIGADDRLLVLTETAGSATDAGLGRDRDLTAILRSGLSGRLAPEEIAVPGNALYASTTVDGPSVVAELVNRYARTRGISSAAGAALSFVEEYARLLLPPVLGLAAEHGIGLEAHLQNCVPTFVDGVPRRMVLRDLAGMRVYPPRLRARLPLWPGAVIVTDDVEVMLSKVAYTAFQAHLGELVVRLVESHGLDETAAWSRVRSIVDDTYAGLDARADHAFLTAETVPHKALLGMRLAAGRGLGGDIYVRVENPLR